MTDSWIGGDLAGLARMAATMRSVAPKLPPMVTELSSQTDRLVADGGFSGDAADQFKRRWSEDAVTLGALGSVVARAASTIGDLATHLSTLDNQLHDAARVAVRAGVEIGPHGEPPTSQQPGARATAEEIHTLTAALTTYAADYNQLMHLAKGFRLAAMQDLSSLDSEIAPPDGGSAGLKPDQAVTISGFIKSLYVIPDEQNRVDAKVLPAEIKAAKSELRQARKDLHAARAAFAAEGRKLPAGAAERAADNAAVAKYKGLQNDLTAALDDDGRTIGKALDYSVADLAKALPGVGRAAATLPDFLDFAKDIPVVDIVASAAATGFQVKDDTDKGWSFSEAATKDGTAGATGLLAGAGVVALAAAAPVDVPVAAVVAVGGVAVVGVGDLVYQGFHEHWAEDIHNDGVVGGVLDGSGHVLENTGKDLGHMATSVGHAVSSGAKKIWDSIF